MNALEPEHESSPPLNDIWTTLRQRWLAIELPDDTHARKGRRTNESLTDHLNRSLGRAYRPQAVSQWATGSDKRNPPWEAVFLLLRELKLDLVLSGTGEARLVPARGR